MSVIFSFFSTLSNGKNGDRGTNRSIETIEISTTNINTLGQSTTREIRIQNGNSNGK